MNSIMVFVINDTQEAPCTVHTLRSLDPLELVIKPCCIRLLHELCECSCTRTCACTPPAAKVRAVP